MPTSDNLQSINFWNNPKGIYELLPWNKKKIKSHETGLINGFVGRIYWRNFYNDDNQLDFNLLENHLQQADKKNLSYKLMIAPGMYSPQWVLDNSETVLMVAPNGEEKGKEVHLPLPWDDYYLQTWFDFLEQIATYADNPRFSYMAITGPNGHNGEVSLPREEADSAKWLELCYGSPMVLKQRLEGAYFRTFVKYKELFSGKIKYTLALINRSLPIIQDEDYLIKLEKKYKKNLLALGKAIDPEWFGFQTNGLNGSHKFPHWALLNKFDGFKAFQTKSPNNLYKNLDCFPEVDMENWDLESWLATQQLLIYFPPTQVTYKRAIMSHMIEYIIKYKVNCLELYQVVINDPVHFDQLQKLKEWIFDVPPIV